MFNGLKKWVITMGSRSKIALYFRSNNLPHEYFSGSIVFEEKRDSGVYWQLRKIGDKKLIKITPLELAQNFDPCSPYEAMSTL